MIKNIIFDLSEVIITGYIGIEAEVEKYTGIKASEFLTRKLDTLNIFFDLMRGFLTEEEYYTALLANTNWSITPNDMKKIVRQYLNQPVKGTLDIIKKLKGKYKLILLSDYVQEWKVYILQNNHDLKIFDKMYFSCDFGKLKSDKEMFKYFLNQTKLKPEETLFIDDSSININNADQAGIKTILFTNAQDLEQKLIDLKII